MSWKAATTEVNTTFRLFKRKEDTHCAKQDERRLGKKYFHVLIKLTQLLADHQLREFFEPING